MAVAKGPTFVFQDDSRFLAWMNSIARNVILESLSDQRCRPRLMRIKQAGSSGGGVSESDLGTRGRTPSSIVAGNENSSVLHQALSHLPELYRRVIVLYRLEGRPLGEVAACLQRTTGATCRLLARAMKQLRSDLGDS